MGWIWVHKSSFYKISKVKPTIYLSQSPQVEVKMLRISTKDSFFRSELSMSVLTSSTTVAALLTMSKALMVSQRILKISWWRRSRARVYTTYQLWCKDHKTLATHPRTDSCKRGAAVLEAEAKPEWQSRVIHRWTPYSPKKALWLTTLVMSASCHQSKK